MCCTRDSSLHWHVQASAWLLCCRSGDDEELQDRVLDGVSEDQSGEEGDPLPNDGEEENTTPDAPSTSHKGILYCQVGCLLLHVRT